MKIQRNPFTNPTLNPTRFSTYFGRGVETISFARDDFYKEAKTFRFGPIEIRFKWKTVEKEPGELPDNVNTTTHVYRK